MNKRSVVLIVDDEVSNIEILSAALEDDYEVRFATSADEAYELLRNVMPDLVLLDVLMPGTDGYAVCRHIKADILLSDIPIIFTTALGDEGAEIIGSSSVPLTTSPSRYPPPSFRRVSVIISR